MDLPKKKNRIDQLIVKIFSKIQYIYNYEDYIRKLFNNKRKIIAT